MIERIGPVVAQENHQRVVFLTEFLDFGQHAPDGLIHPVHLRGIDGHAQVFKFLFLFRQRIPRGNRVGPRRERPFLFGDAELNLLLITLLAQFVPAEAILPAILGDVLRPGLERRVRRVEGQIHEERLAPVAAGATREELDRVIRIRIGGVEFAIVRRLEGFVVQAVGRIALEVIAPAAEVTEVMIEAALHGIASQMPLAQGEGGVTRRPHGLPHRQPLFDAQPAVLPILPAHQRGACRLALGGVVKLREAQAIGRQTVQIRRRDLAAVTAEVGVAHVIGEDEQDVGFRSGGRLNLGDRARKAKPEHEEWKQEKSFHHLPH